MFPPLYVILDIDDTSNGSDAGSAAPDPLAISLDLARAGVRLLQIRDKRGSSRRLCAESRELVSRLAPLGVLVIVNDRPDIAAITSAAGVHVGQDDLSVEAARRVCGTDRWVGVSTHTLDQLRAADATSADYIALGPIFTTSTKVNPDPVVGIELLRAARSLTRKPLVAIGGITIESAAQVFRAGADSVAVVRDVLRAPDPAARAAEYLRLAESVGRAAR